MQKISDDVNSQTKHLGPEKNWIESNIKHLKVSRGFEAIANCYKSMIKKNKGCDYWMLIYYKWFRPTLKSLTS